MMATCSVFLRNDQAIRGSSSLPKGVSYTKNLYPSFPADDLVRCELASINRT